MDCQVRFYKMEILGSLPLLANSKQVENRQQNEQISIIFDLEMIVFLIFKR